MLPTYNETYTHYTTPSGSTQLILYRRKTKLSERKKVLLQQKLLGLALVVIGIIGCFIMPEDCGGCLFAGFMGVCRLFSNYMG